MKRPFTLLEVMVAFALLVIAAGAIGLKMHHGVQEKRFRTEMDRLKTRCIACQKMAIAMQSDWEGVLRKEGKKWIFETRCLDSIQEKKLSPLVFETPFQFSFNDQTASGIQLDFYSSGLVLPKGKVKFTKDKDKSQQWNIQEIFSLPQN